MRVTCTPINLYQELSILHSTPVIVLTVSSYNIFPIEEASNFYSKHIITNRETGECNLQDLKWIFIELKKFDKPLNEIQQSGLEIWSYFIRRSRWTYWEEANTKGASNALDTSTWSRADQIAYTRALVYAMDKVSGIEFVKKESYVEIAKKCLTRGHSIEEICEVTGLKGRFC